MEWVEHLLRDKEELSDKESVYEHLPMLLNEPRKATLVQTVFAIDFDYQAPLQIIRRLPHDLRITILEDVVSPNFDLTITWPRLHSRLLAEIDKLALEIVLRLRHICVRR